MRRERLEVGLRERRPRLQVVAEVLADLGDRREAQVLVEPLGPVGRGLVARPLDPAAATQLLVAEPGVVARPPARALLPRLEALLRRRPLHQRLAVLVPQVEPTGVVEEDLHVRPRLAGRLDRLLGEVDGAVGVRERARLLAPERRRQHHVGEPRRLGQERVGDDEEEPLAGEDRADPVELRERDGRVRAAHPEEVDRALLGVAEDLHRVRRRAPVRDLQRLDVPEPRQLGDVRLVLPVAEAGEVAVAARLACVLRGRLAVHLQDPAARPADHAAEQVDVVRRARGRGRLVRLIDALEHEREQVLRLADHLRSPPHVVGRDTADLGDAIGRVRRDRLLERVEADRVQVDELAVDPALLDQLLREPVQRREVRARPDRQVHLGLPSRLGHARVDHDRARPVGPVQPVELVGPENGLRLGRVDADVEDRVAELDVVDPRWLPVAAERLLQRLAGRRGAEARVAVEVVRPDSAADDQRQRVVVLEEELTARVEAERAASLGRDQLPRALGDEVHRLVPARLAQLAVAADEWPQQPVLGVVRLPAVEALRPEPAVVDAVGRPPADADDPAVADADVEAAAVGAEDAGRLDPAFDGPVRVLVDAHGPVATTRVRRPRPPRIRNAIDHRGSTFFRPPVR